MIKREYPYMIRLKEYRYPKEHVKECLKLACDEEYMRQFKLYVSNIDYETGKRIIFHSDRSIRLREKFDMITRFKHRFDVSFEGMKNVDYNAYLKECDEIDERNVIIKKRNSRVNDIAKEMNKLGKWEDYIEFDGRSYGVLPVLNNKHRENDCFGEIEFYAISPMGHVVYRCNKCFKYMDQDLMNLICGLLILLEIFFKIYYLSFIVF